jgi:hypothetical protein
MPGMCLRAARSSTIFFVLFCFDVAFSMSPSLFAGKLRSLGAFYNIALDRNPVIINCLQGSAVAACGDLVSQKIQAFSRSRKQATGLQESSISVTRMMKASTTGIAFNGLIMPAYYGFVQRVWPSRKPMAVALKTAADAAVFGLFGNAATIAIRGRLEVDVFHGDDSFILRFL